MPNKVYVRGYKTLNKDEIVPPPRPFARPENIRVGYTVEPVWQFPDLAAAEIECTSLKFMDVHIGPHYCDFSVEALDEGRFAIVCSSHPSDLKMVSDL